MDEQITEQSPCEGYLALFINEILDMSSQGMSAHQIARALSQSGLSGRAPPQVIFDFLA
jgi:hypothetical protein